MTRGRANIESPASSRNHYPGPPLFSRHRKVRLVHSPSDRVALSASFAGYGDGPHHPAVGIDVGCSAAADQVRWVENEHRPVRIPEGGFVGASPTRDLTVNG